MFVGHFYLLLGRSFQSTVATVDEEGEYKFEK